MRDIPVDVLLSFPTPNYVDPVTRGPALLITNVIFMGLVTIFVVLRLYTRIHLKRWFGVDDWFIILAYIFTMGMNSAVILANTTYYWDRHVWDIPIPAIPSSEKIVMASKVLFSCAASFTRMSLICFYYRLIGDAKRRVFRWMLHISMFYVVAILISFVLLSIFQCTPIKAYWIFPATGKCLDEGTVTLICGAINCTADLLVTILPIPMVLRLSLPLKQRVGVVVLLSLGFIVTIAGIVRTYYIWRALIDTYDESWFGYPLWICASVEIDLGLLCACAPALRQLINTYFPGFGRSLSRFGYKWSTGADEHYGHSSHKRSRGFETTENTENSRHRSETLLSVNSEGKSRLPKGFRTGYDRPWTAQSGCAGDEEHELRDTDADMEKGFAMRITEETLRDDEIRQQLRSARSPNQARLYDPDLYRQMRESIEVAVEPPMQHQASVKRKEEETVEGGNAAARQRSKHTPGNSSDLSWYDDRSGSRRFAGTHDLSNIEYQRDVELRPSRPRGDSDTIMSADDVSSMISTGQWPLQVPIHGSPDGVQRHAVPQRTRPAFDGR